VAAVAAVTGRQLLIALRVLLVMTVILGIGYPLTILGIGQAFAPGRAQGSLATGPDGTIVGSTLIGQAFTGDRWFWPRPSAAGDGYDAMASGGSNLAADSPELLHQVQQRRAALAAANGVDAASIPPDALTASGSGLDPDISPTYALLQVNRVAKARGLDPAAVRSLVEDHVLGRPWKFLGQERVNVLQLNLALARWNGS